MQGTPKTTRNRPCECEHGCGSKLRASRAVLARGLFLCPCGGRMLPSVLEDASDLHALGVLSDADLAAHPEWEAYREAVASVAQGRKGTKGTSGTPLAKTAAGRASVDERAFERLYAARSAAATENRLAALKAHAYGADVQSDPLPF